MGIGGPDAAPGHETEVASRLAAIVESSADAILGKTLDGDITSWNAGAEHIYGYTADEIVGHNVSELIQPEALDLRTVLADARDLLRTSIGGGVELRITPAANPATIMADRGQLEQVVLNLAVNARDAMPQGGTLTIGVAAAELDRQYARLHPGMQSGRYVELSVTDTGTGIAPEVVARMFEPFFTTKPERKGTGLGLSTVYGIVTQAGGSVAVESAVGAGTTFRLYFPALDAPAVTAPRGTGPGARTVAQQPGLTILVVDDEPAALDT